MIRAFLVATAAAFIFAGSACGGDKAEQAVPLSPSAVATTVATNTVPTAAPVPTSTPDPNDVDQFCESFGLVAIGATYRLDAHIKTTDGLTVQGASAGACSTEGARQFIEAVYAFSLSEAIDSALSLTNSWNSEELKDYLQASISEKTAGIPQIQWEWIFLLAPDVY